MSPKALVPYAEAHAPRKPKARKRIKARRVTKAGRNSDPAKLAWLRTLWCRCVTTDPQGCWGVVETHHDRHHGSRATDKKALPACAGHHRTGPHSVEALGREGFQVYHGLDLDTECAKYETEWRVRKASGAA